MVDGISWVDLTMPWFFSWRKQTPNMYHNISKHSRKHEFLGDKLCGDITMSLSESVFPWWWFWRVYEFMESRTTKFWSTKPSLNTVLFPEPPGAMNSTVTDHEWEPWQSWQIFIRVHGPRPKPGVFAPMLGFPPIFFVEAMPKSSSYEWQSSWD